MSAFTTEIDTLSGKPQILKKAFQRILHNYKWNSAFAASTIDVLGDGDYTNTTTVKSVDLGLNGNGDVTIFQQDWSSAGSFINIKLLGGEFTKLPEFLATYLNLWVTEGYDERTAATYACEDLSNGDPTFNIENSLETLISLLTYSEMA